MDARPTPEAIAAHYTSAIAPLIAEFEAERQHAVNSFTLFSAIAIIVNIGLIGGLLLTDMYATQQGWPFQLTIAAIVGSCVLAWRPLSKFRSETKTKMLAALTPLFAGFSVQDNEGLPAAIMARSGIFPSYDIYRGSNLIVGTYRGVTLQSGDIELIDKVRTKRGEREKTVFRGVSYVFSFNKAFSGQVHIIADGGWLLNNMLGAFRKFDRIALEDPQFEDVFEVHGENQVEARYLLTTAFMERLLHLARANDNKLEAAFFDKQLLIKIERDTSRFTVTNPLRTIDWHAETMRFVDEMADAFGIVDALKLNHNLGL